MQKHVTTYLDHREKQRLETQCRSAGLSTAELLRRLVRWWMDERQHGNSTPVDDEADGVA